MRGRYRQQHLAPAFVGSSTAARVRSRRSLRRPKWLLFPASSQPSGFVDLSLGATVPSRWALSMYVVSWAVVGSSWRHHFHP